MGPVSYTHLDVYKRQTIGNDLLQADVQRIEEALLLFELALCVTKGHERIRGVLPNPFGQFIHLCLEKGDAGFGLSLIHI